MLAQDILQPENAYRRLVRVVHFLPDIACSRGQIRRPGATCEPATGSISHNGHIQVCHVQLAPQIFSATVLFSAPLSRKHSCRVIGASLRSLPTVSDGETAITNTLPMRISHGKPSLPVSRLPSPNGLQNSFKNTFQSWSGDSDDKSPKGGFERSIFGLSKPPFKNTLQKKLSKTPSKPSRFELK
jgi:hypothetical protein